MTREPRNERVIDVGLNRFRTKNSLLNASPHWELCVQKIQKGLSARHLKELAVPVTEAELDGGRVDFN